MAKKRKYAEAVSDAEYLNTRERKPEWEGIVFVPFEVKRGKCITPCPYKEKTPSQHLAEIMREQGMNFGSDDDCAKVGSSGCACCWWHCGYYKDDILLCGKEARLTTISKESEEKYEIIHDLKTPRKLKLKTEED